MTRFLDRVLGAMRLDFAAQADREIDARHESIAAEEVAHYGRGNVHIQDDEVITGDDLDREVEELASLELHRN